MAKLYDTSVTKSVNEILARVSGEEPAACGGGERSDIYVYDSSPLKQSRPSSLLQPAPLLKEMWGSCKRGPLDEGLLGGGPLDGGPLGGGSCSCGLFERESCKRGS